MTSHRLNHAWTLLLAVPIILSACGGAQTGSRQQPPPTVQPSPAAARAQDATADDQSMGGGPGPATTPQAVVADVAALSGAAASQQAAPTEVPVTATAVPSVLQTTTPAATPTPLPPTAVPATASATVVAQASPPARTATSTVLPTPAQSSLASPRTAFSTDPDPLQIDVMRKQPYPGSPITFEQTLAPGSNYTQYIVSYKSDGYKIYALMTVPSGTKPATGWPVIIFNHGYIPPNQYRTTERYVEYVASIARAGYIVFKSDYRGHGSSEGPTVGGGNGGPYGGGYGSPGYTNDVLNALASLKAYKDADPNRIGMWGHSMGGQVTLRAMVVSKDIKAGVIWGGVVAPYPDIFGRGNRNPRPGQPTPIPQPTNPANPVRRGWQQELTAKYGTVDQNPKFWSSISPNSYLADISGPLQLDHSVTDEEVPVAASQILYKEMQDAGKTVEFYTYPGDNHNISGNFGVAMQRSIAFFDKYVKGAH